MAARPILQVKHGNHFGAHATNPKEAVNQVSSRAFKVKGFHWGEQTYGIEE